MEGVNESYDSIKDKDLNSDSGSHRMLLACTECGAIFSMKACGNRSLFPWFGYHPIDGNCAVITSELLDKNHKLVIKCNCEPKLVRVTSKESLDNVISKVMLQTPDLPKEVEKTNGTISEV